jgi:hypothetical protein
LPWSSRAHETHVGEPRHGELDELIERGVRLEPGRQHRRRLGQELRLELAPALGGHVAPDVHGEVRRAALVVNGVRSQQRPPLLAGGLFADAHRCRRARLAGQHAAAGQLRPVERLSLLVECLEALEDLGRPRAQQRLGRFVAARAGGCIIGIQQAAVRPLGGHAVGDALEDDRELLALLAVALLAGAQPRFGLLGRRARRDLGLESARRFVGFDALNGVISRTHAAAPGSEREVSV